MRVSTVSKSQRSLVTELQLRLATRDHKNTEPLDRRLDGEAFQWCQRISRLSARQRCLAFEANRSKAERMKQEWRRCKSRRQINQQVRNEQTSSFVRFSCTTIKHNHSKRNYGHKDASSHLHTPRRGEDSIGSSS